MTNIPFFYVLCRDSKELRHKTVLKLLLKKKEKEKEDLLSTQGPGPNGDSSAPTASLSTQGPGPNAYSLIMDCVPHLFLPVVVGCWCVHTLKSRRLWAKRTLAKIPTP